MKILYPFSGVAGIFFPIGRIKDEGTCEFATERCLKECAALKNAFDETIVGHEAKVATYKFMISHSVLDVCQQIIKEMRELGCKILYWFASGDCLRRHTDKIGRIMKHLSIEGIIQCGFTRNKKVWYTAENIPLARIALTVEANQRKPRNERGIIAVPDYQSGEVKLYQNRTHLGSCGAGFQRRRLQISTGCDSCYQQRVGCFSGF